MRKFLVVLDDSRESLNAIRFAAMRAAKTGGGVVVLAVVPPGEFQHWAGVGDVMRAEAEEHIHAHFDVFAKWMRDRPKVEPELVIRHGERVGEILDLIKEDGEIGVLVLGVADEGPGPLVKEMTKRMGSMSVPVTFVPGELSADRLAEIT